jgi:hypothetical protein
VTIATPAVRRIMWYITNDPGDGDDFSFSEGLLLLITPFQQQGTLKLHFPVRMQVFSVKKKCCN